MAYFAFLLTPLKQSNGAVKSIAALAPEIAAARAQIRQRRFSERKLSGQAIVHKFKQ